LDQFVAVIRQLEPDARSAVTKALMETELDACMAALIESLARRRSGDDITDAEIVAEVNAVRKQNGGAYHGAPSVPRSQGSPCASYGHRWSR